jgi:hypothetical protein
VRGGGEPFPNWIAECGIRATNACDSAFSVTRLIVTCHRHVAGTSGNDAPVGFSRPVFVAFAGPAEYARWRLPAFGGASAVCAGSGDHAVLEEASMDPTLVAADASRACIDFSNARLRIHQKNCASLLTRAIAWPIFTLVGDFLTHHAKMPHLPLGSDAGLSVSQRSGMTTARTCTIPSLSLDRANATTA